MLTQFKKTWLPVAAAALCGALASAAPAQAQWGSRTVVIERPVARHVIVERPVVRRVARHVVERPVVVYRVVQRPAYARRVSYGWRPHHPRHWHDRPTCRLPERWLCR